MRIAWGMALVGLAVSVCAVAYGQQAKTVWDGVYTAEQAARGARLYGEACARCHGDALGGVEAAPPLAGETFNSNWEGIPLADLFERMRASMPQDNPGSLSRAQNADLLAHMLSAGGFPAGAAELNGQPGALTQIKFVTYKP